MALPIMNFPILTQQQASPFFTGAQQSTDLINGLLQNYAQSQRNKVLPQSLQEQLLAAHLTNQINAPKAQMAPQITAADLAYKQAQVPNLQAQTQEAMARTRLGIPAEAAAQWASASKAPSEIELAKADAESKSLFAAQDRMQGYIDKYGMDDPKTQEALANYRQTLKQHQAMGDWKSMLAQTMPERVLSTSGKEINEATAMGAGFSPSAASAIGNTPYGQMPTDIQAQSAQQLVSGQNVDLSNHPFLRGLKSDNVSAQPKGMISPQQLLPQQEQTSTIGSTLPPGHPLHEDSPSGITVNNNPLSNKEAANMFITHVAKMGMTARTANKLQAGVTAAYTIKKVDGLMSDQDILNYTGFAGQLKLRSDFVKSSMGTDVPALDKYKELMSNLHVLNDQVTQYYGTSIQKSQTDALTSAMNPLGLTSTPQGMKRVWNSFKDTFGKEFELTRQIGTDPKQYITPITKNDLNSGIGMIDISKTGHTLEEFKQAAKNAGISDVESFIRTYKESKSIK